MNGQVLPSFEKYHANFPDNLRFLNRLRYVLIENLFQGRLGSPWRLLNFNGRYS